MKFSYLLLLIGAFTASCEFNKSVKVDLTTGLTSKGDGLSCSAVSLSSNDEPINRNEFIFGEKIKVSFTNIEGFKKENNTVYPGMSLLILDKKGDTMLYSPDLYADYTDAIDMESLILTATLKVGDPIKSNKTYALYIHTWDKKGKGTFDTELQFSVIPNPSLKHNTANISFDEIFLFDQENGIGITSNKIKQSQETLLIYDGLKGFKQQDGKCKVGLSMKATDAKGQIILDETDLLQEEEPEFSRFSEQFISSFSLGNQKVINPIHFEVLLWDKIGDGKIKTTIDIEVK